MSSWDKGTVILVKVEKIELFSDPVGLSRAIERSPFHKIKMKVIRTNKKKGLIVYELDEPNQSTIDKVLGSS